MKIPHYWGGMTLSDMDTAYRYEYFLKELLERRYAKYKQNWELLLAMSYVFSARVARGQIKFLWPLPEDPLVSINDDATYWTFLRCNHKTLNIIRLECYKVARRNRGMMWDMKWQ